MAKNNRNSTRQTQQKTEETKATESSSTETQSTETQSTENQVPETEQQSQETETQQTETTTQQDTGDTQTNSGDTEPKTETTTATESATEEQEAEKSKPVDTGPVAILTEGLADYAKAMAANAPVDKAMIDRNQTRLRSLVGVLMGAEDREFEEAMKVFLNTAREHRKGAFNERLLFRGFSTMRISANERNRLESILSLILAAVDSKNPRQVEGVDLTALFRNGISSDAEQQKLQAFFKS